MPASFRCRANSGVMTAETARSGEARRTNRSRCQTIMSVLLAVCGDRPRMMIADSAAARSTSAHDPVAVIGVARRRCRAARRPCRRAASTSPPSREGELVGGAARGLGEVVQPAEHDGPGGAGTGHGVDDDDVPGFAAGDAGTKFSMTSSALTRASPVPAAASRTALGDPGPDAVVAAQRIPHADDAGRLAQDAGEAVPGVRHICSPRVLIWLVGVDRAVRADEGPADGAVLALADAAFHVPLEGRDDVVLAHARGCSSSSMTALNMIGGPQTKATVFSTGTLAFSIEGVDEADLAVPARLGPVDGDVGLEAGDLLPLLDSRPGTAGPSRCGRRRGG